LQIIAITENNLLSMQNNACKGQNAASQWRHCFYQRFNQTASSDMRTKINNPIAKPNPALEGLPRAYAGYGKKYRNRPSVIRGGNPG
jgi:hypothetical protein